MTRVFLFAAVMVLAHPGFANEKFRVAGDTVFYDTETGDDESEISSADVKDLRDLLRVNPEVSRIELNSGGGSYFGGLRMGRLIQDFELDTHVVDICSSSCFYILLGGTKRTMARGARIGLHHTSWSASSLAEYFADEKDEAGWDTPFDMTSDIYVETQLELYNEMKYVVSRGVDPLFALESLKVRRDGLWYPTRKELLDADVLTE
ncbi:MAG: hypothetical protein AAF198_11575 [Pseudomonadota bacterium]